MGREPYTGYVNWRFAALLVCLAAAAHAENGVYKFYVPAGSAVSKVEWSNAGLGWDVAVSFDSEHCQVTCAYRRARDRFSPASLLRYLPLPATTIRITMRRKF